MSQGRLSGKRIFVTGASRGIGAGIAKRLSEQGARLAISYSSSPEAAEKVLEGLEGEGHFSLKMDVSSSESVQAGFAEVLEKLGGLDGLVNNAGITKDQLLMRMKDEDFDAVLQTNLKGTFLCTRAAMKPMLKAKGGSIVNITSVVGHSGNPGQSNYTASKAGVEGFTRSVALEMGSRQMRLNCVAPGFIVTEMTGALNEGQTEGIVSRIPLQRMGNVDDIASAVIYLLSDESSYVTGQTLHVNGGLYM